MIELKKFTEENITDEYLKNINNLEHTKYMDIAVKWSYIDVLKYINNKKEGHSFYSLYYNNNFVGTVSLRKKRLYTIVGYMVFMRFTGQGITNKMLCSLPNNNYILGIAPENIGSLIVALKSGYVIYSFLQGERPELWLKKNKKTEIKE